MQQNGAFDAERFRRSATRTVEQLSDYLARATARETPVLVRQDPSELLASWADRGGDDSLDALVEAILEHSNHLHHPGYMGHQVAVTLPGAAILEMVSALLNNGMAIYEMGQLQTIMERQVVERLSATIGFKSGSGGVMTHGGSLGNLTALLAARQAKAGYDVWTEGQRQPMSVLVSEEAHYCIARAVQAMGWGSAGAWPVPADDQHRMRPDALQAALEDARAAGRQVIAVVASACSTATGSFDPIGPLADFCDQHGLWLHVDGAHGASLALSESRRGVLDGIARADSVVWDLHKMMSLPALSTAVLFRDERSSFESFGQKAEYLFDPTAADEQWFNVGLRTLECTKRAMGATAWIMLQTLGMDWFGEHVDRLMEATGQLTELLRAHEEFELATEPQANIVCFRHRPGGLQPGPELDAHQSARRDRAIDAGGHYLVQTRIRNETWLRVTVMNPLSTPRDFESLLSVLA